MKRPQDDSALRKPFRNANAGLKVLSPDWQKAIISFAETKKSKSKTSIRINRRVCVQMSLSFERHGVSKPRDLTYEAMEAYCSELEPEYGHWKLLIEFLFHVEGLGLCRKGMGWFCQYRRTDKVAFYENFSEEQRTHIERHRKESLEFPLIDLIDAEEGFLEAFAKHRYNSHATVFARQFIEPLYVFLDMNELGYEPEIARIWLEHLGTKAFKTNCVSIRRMMDLFNQYIADGDISPGSVARYKPLMFDGLDEWCKNVLYDFLEQKEKEMDNHNSVKMFRVANTRFCMFLMEKGLKSFKELTPELVKDFNLQDRHSTARGKNTYNSRIRRFLRFLERKGIVENAFIHEALFCSSAPLERIVVTLTEQERLQMKNVHDKATTPVQLRDRAINLIGLKMGLRGCDIVRIRLTDIDWKRGSIKVLQAKTGNEIECPMPVEVGNAICSYLLEGRHETDSPYLFIGKRCPYQGMQASACNKALRRTLPDRKVRGSGFHVMRRTFATDNLRRNIPPTVITDLLGSQSTEALNPYLMLDSDRMRLCTMSLAETGLVKEV